MVNWHCQKKCEKFFFFFFFNLWTYETKLNLFYNYEEWKVWRRRETVCDPKHATSSVKHGWSNVMACMAACGTEWLLMMWLLKNVALAGYASATSLLRLSQMLQNWSDSTSQCKYIINQSAVQKQPKSFSRQQNGKLFNGLVSHLISAQ